MCLGFSTYFSINMVSFPNALNASFFASLNAFETSSTFLITRIPLPPPPAAAFNMTGKPILQASSLAISTDVRSWLLSSITGTPTSIAIFFAATLSPSIAIASGVGPINFIPSSRHFCANSTFSDKNPYPG